MDKIVYLILLLSLSLVCSSDETYFTEEDTTNHTYTKNAYRILRVAPWSNFEDITKRFQAIYDDFHNGNYAINMTETEEAYQYLKEQYELKGERTMQGILYEWVYNIFFYICIFGIVYGFTWLLYKIQVWFSGFVFWEVVGFMIIERFIPHYFDQMTTQYIVSFILGIVLYKFWALINVVLVFLGIKKKEEAKAAPVEENKTKSD